MNERDERLAMETVSVLAKQCRAFYLALREQKFPDAAAMVLTSTWLQSSIIKFQQPPGPTEEER